MGGKVQEGVKLSAKSYCEFIYDALSDRLENLNLKQRRKIIFMHNNAPSHASKKTRVLALTWLQERHPDGLIHLFPQFKSNRKFVGHHQKEVFIAMESSIHQKMISGQPYRILRRLWNLLLSKN